ncbi:LysR family transcriptional regulator [Paenibacillus chartarius]|uniref:LysR family transcriptional regulator n=1 Tax=Paenibacillus chartarius TaxID=747481 RepID=A0ABV6DUE2_9BACL
MESSDLRVFQAVVREGSITRAAERLGYVQSNVTARIRQLETELQTVLFHRHNRGMTPTPSGKMLLSYADKIIGLLDEAGKAMSLSSEPHGPLQLGSTQTSAAVYLPALLANFGNRYPKVVLSLATGSSRDMVEKVLQYELDGAFVTYPVNHPELQMLKVAEEELVVFTSPAITDIEEAMTKPILVLPGGCCIRNVFERWLEANGKPTGIIMEFGTIEAIIGGVSAGLGISMLARDVVRKAGMEGRIRIHAVSEPFRRSETVFVTRKDTIPSGALRAFLEMLQERTDYSQRNTCSTSSGFPADF